MKTNKRKDGLKRQAQIMEIALELFSSKGYHSTSIDDILEKAGIAKGTFYLHFNGKIDLLDHIIESRFEVFYKNVEVLDISAFTSIDELKNMYIGVAQFLMSSVELRMFIRLILREYTGMEAQIFTKVNNFMERLVLMSTENIKRAQERGSADKSLDPYICSLSIIGAVKEMAFRWSVLEENLDVKRTVSGMVDAFMNGLTPA